MRNYSINKQVKRILAGILTIIMVFVSIDLSQFVSVQAATEYDTLYLIDNTAEKWVKNDNAKIKAIDNSNGHTAYWMTKKNETTWSVKVPKSAYNITFNRYAEDKTTQWNSWSAGGRDKNNAYYVDGSEYGHWGISDEEEEYFHAGDIIYLDVSEFTQWENDDAVMYANFTNASKEENSGKDVLISGANKEIYNPNKVKNKVEKGIYQYIVTQEDEEATMLRFWRGNDTTLWNCSVVLSYDDYLKGLNCVKITKWENTGDIYHYKYNIDKEKDTDNDNVPDYIENLLGTDITSDDTDGDGLSDYIEIYITGTDPIYVDTDENGVNDGDEDADADGLTNLEEITYGTNAALKDTDGDSLTDYDEINIYGTDPLSADTDKDGANDGIEVSMGTDPLVAESSFKVHATSSDIDTVKASVDIELSAKQLTTLSVERYEDEFMFPKEIPGYIGGCYEFSVDGSFDEATINFEFDETLLEDSDFNPVIYYFNESEQELEALDTTVKGNVASATTCHFSKYILLNRIVYEESFTWQDVWTSNNYTDVEIVLVIDDSGSMTQNDKTNQRLLVAQTLIDHLPRNSKVGVLKFTNSTTRLTSKITSDKDAAKSYLTTSYFKSSGGTYMYSAVNSALGLFESPADTTLRMMVVLSDGETSDKSSHSTTVTAANNSGVKIYSIGLGSGSSSYFTNYMKPLAVNTGGMFYLASNATQLSDIYKDITEKIDIETDSDSDGIPDYYEDNMIMFNGMRLTLDKNNPDTDNDGLKDGEEVCELKYEYNSDKTKVKVTGKIIADPTVKDTDYDGINDDIDENPLLGKFTGKMISYYDASDASYTFDYRQFFENSTTFNKAISTSSIIFANTIYDNWGFSYETGNSGEIKDIKTLMELHGFENVENYDLKINYDDDDVSEIGIGFHNVTYKDETLTVLAVIVRGTNGTIKEWSSNVNLGDPDSWSSDCHKGFYTAEQRIMKYLKEYLDANEELFESNIVYWVTGHSRGAAIANLLSAELIDNGKNVYGYTYASPGTTISSEKTAAKYNSIFNLKNSSDVITYVPLPQWDFGTFGVTIHTDITALKLDYVWCKQTGRSQYNAFSSSVLNVATNRLYKSCASSWAEAYDYAGVQNISDDQYAMISERAKRYCKIEERKTLFGNHKGYKLYPSTIFMFQICMEIYAGSKTEQANSLELLKEFINSKFAGALILLIGEVLITGIPEELDESMVGDGHSPSTYYVLNNKFIETEGV
ncbi:MAG: VWA domain-containing protein [Lachnospiraceae bacterium]|nr:VWA domain-containing protein [Lachnospiraceae bacterium]